MSRAGTTLHAEELQGWRKARPRNPEELTAGHEAQLVWVADVNERPRIVIQAEDV